MRLHKQLLSFQSYASRRQTRAGGNNRVGVWFNEKLNKYQTKIKRIRVEQFCCLTAEKGKHNGEPMFLRAESSSGGGQEEDRGRTYRTGPQLKSIYEFMYGNYKEAYQLFQGTRTNQNKRG